jgi:hypothetical protein
VWRPVTAAGFCENDKEWVVSWPDARLWTSEGSFCFRNVEGNRLLLLPVPVHCRNCLLTHSCFQFLKEVSPGQPYSKCPCNMRTEDTKCVLLPYTKPRLIYLTALLHSLILAYVSQRFSLENNTSYPNYPQKENNTLSCNSFPRLKSSSTGTLYSNARSLAWFFSS